MKSTLSLLIIPLVKISYLLPHLENMMMKDLGLVKEFEAVTIVICVVSSNKNIPDDITY